MQQSSAHGKSSNSLLYKYSSQAAQPEAQAAANPKSGAARHNFKSKPRDESKKEQQHATAIP